MESFSGSMYTVLTTCLYVLTIRPSYRAIWSDLYYTYQVVLLYSWSINQFINFINESLSLLLHTYTHTYKYIYPIQTCCTRECCTIHQHHHHHHDSSYTLYTLEIMGWDDMYWWRMGNGDEGSCSKGRNAERQRSRKAGALLLRAVLPMYYVLYYTETSTPCSCYKVVQWVSTS